MKVGVVGSRSFKNEKIVFDILDSCVMHRVDTIVSGGASGVDTTAYRYAKANGMDILICFPDWATDGKAAGPIRNKRLVKHCDRILAFWDGKSKGTKHTIDTARELGVPVRIVYDK